MITFTPNFTFHTGRILPAIAFGTGTSYFERNNDVTEGILKAFGAGFRYIDTAIAYQTEEGVGKFPHLLLIEFLKINEKLTRKFYSRLEN